ncbi:hypothetical protein GF354_02025 [Candidatus Peregrinibacteria bacterium]|nr:hypothetical protein [Candidatus Peregrinibacteria bacterium]
MTTRFNNTSNLTKIIIILEFLLVAYLLYSLTKIIYNNYRIDSYIETFRAENAQIEEENRKKTEDYLYFTSEEYIDKVIKQNWNYVNPGEEIIILSPEVVNTEIEVNKEELPDAKTYSGMSNPAQWWSLFFDN